MLLLASVLQAASVSSVRGPYYLGVGSISDSLSLSSNAGTKIHLIQGTCSAYYGSATLWMHIDMLP